MSFDPTQFSTKPLSDEQLGGWGEDWGERQEFPPAIPADNYHLTVTVDDTRDGDCSLVAGVIKKGDREGLTFVGGTFSFKVAEGDFVGRAGPRFQYLNSIVSPFTGHSDIGDMLNSFGAPEPSSDLEIAEIIMGLSGNEGASCRAQVDWRGICRACRTAYLDENPDDYRGADKVAIVAKSARQFPDSVNGVGKLDVMDCTTCGEEVRAQLFIRRFLGA